MRAFSVLGNIAIVNFPRKTSLLEKKKFAQNILSKNRAIRTVLEKSGNFKGRLRKAKMKYLAGNKSKEVFYKENNCIFRFDIDSTYFSPRLSGERKEIASKIRKGEEVLVMFAGVAPYSIVIAKNSGAKKVYSNEINREASKYAEINVRLNNLKNKVEIIQGDIKRIAKKMRKENKIFDVIVMPRPNLKDSFLEQAFMLSKKRTRIYYYDFCKIGEESLIIKKIKQEAQRYRKRVKIINKKHAGEIAPYKIRIRVDFEIF